MNLFFNRLEKTKFYILFISFFSIYLTTLYIKGLEILIIHVLISFCFFAFLYSLRIIFNEINISLLFIISFLIFISFINYKFQTAIFIIFLIISCMIIFFYFKFFIKIFTSDLNFILKVKYYDIIFWLIVFLIIIFLGNYNSNGFFAYDMLHPLYSLSIGHSVETISVKIEDISIANKLLKYNFLIERIPFVFSNIFNIDILNAYYFFSIFFLSLFLMIAFFSFQKNFKELNIPHYLFFFFPVYIASSTIIDNVFNRTFTFTTSFLTAFTLILISFNLLLKNKLKYLIVTMLLLVMIKALYFLTLCGGVFLFFLRNIKIKKIFHVFSIILPGFLIIFYLFLMGAADEAHWIIFPQIIYEKMSFILMPNTEFNFSFLRLISLLHLLVFLLIAIFSYYKNSTSKILAVSSFSISGFVGFFLFSELVTLSARHFYNAASFASVILIIYLINNDKFKFFIKKKYLINLINIVTFYIMILTLSQIQFKNHYLDNEIINSYTWLGKNTSNNSGYTLISGHYDFIPKKINGKLINTPSDFVRTALSGNKMYLEFSKYKGGITNKDLSNKLANIIFFYDQFIIFDDLSKKTFEDYKKTVFSTLTYSAQMENEFKNSFKIEKEKSFKAKLIYYLGFKKNWSQLNLSTKVINQTKTIYNNHKQIKDEKLIDWCLNFLKQNNIQYIILESNDNISNILKNITENIYTYKNIKIFKVK